MPILGDEDVALLSKVLIWRIEQAAPADRGLSDVDGRLRQAGRAFRRNTRPLSPDELSAVVERLRDTN